MRVISYGDPCILSGDSAIKTMSCYADCDDDCRDFCGRDWGFPGCACDDGDDCDCHCEWDD